MQFITGWGAATIVVRVEESTRHTRHRLAVKRRGSDVHVTDFIIRSWSTARSFTKEPFQRRRA